VVTPERPERDTFVVVRKVERDPRSDPRPGDELQRAGRLRTVRAVFLPNRVYFISGKLQLCKRLNFHEWRKWARSATVVRRGGGE
jgi:hypothetical protein